MRRLRTAEESLKAYKRHRITAAKQLGYPPVVADLIEQCNSKNEVDRVLTSARHTYK